MKGSDGLRAPALTGVQLLDAFKVHLTHALCSDTQT